ncbi:MAG: methyltransferase [Pseudomonadota bacterium]
MDLTTGVVDTAEDAFLDGRVRLRQPVTGYRAATDPVLLAAATPAVSGNSVLDLGCGVGAAACCLGARVPSLDLHGLELQLLYARLARENAASNAQRFTVHDGDLRVMPRALKESVFDAVMLNPPWHSAEGSGSPDPARDRAHRLDTDMMTWLTAALARTRPGGWVVVIQRAERLPDILAGFGAQAGDIAVLPLAGREGRPAKRVIVKARKGSKGPFRLAPPLVLHRGTAHLTDADDFSDTATAILRDAAPIDF